MLKNLTLGVLRVGEQSMVIIAAQREIRYCIDPVQIFRNGIRDPQIREYGESEIMRS